jgi:Tol biopolymer transport system component
MPDIVNPYIPGQPVDDPKLFFGRREVLTSIREHLVKGRRMFVVSGAPRIGKSSLLRQVPSHLPDEFIAVRIDLTAEDSRDADRLLWHLTSAIGEQLGQQLGIERLEPALADSEAHASHLLDDFCVQVRAALGNRGLVLLLDDLDSLAQGGGSALDSLLAALARWRDRDDGLALVLAVSEALQETLSRQVPHLFGGALSYVLGPLTSEEATRLITWPVDGVLVYDYGVARRLVEMTSGQPHYLQLLCFEMFNRCAAAGWANQRDVDLVLEDLISQELVDFRVVWDESSPPEQAALAALVSLRGARGVATVQEVRTILTKAGARVDPAQVAGALEYLATRGILERLGASSYRFRVALLRDWLGERIDLQRVVRNTRWDDAGAVKPPAGPAVRMLSTRKRQRRPSAQPEAGHEEAADAEPQERHPAGRRWLWMMPLALAGLVLLILARPQLVQAPPATPTATATLAASATVRLATATKTPALPTPVGPVAIASPSDTPAPLPTETPSPTPPVIVARPVPSIAYESREQGERRWSVYVMSSDGSDRVRLAEGQSDFLSAPAWSPDGSKIAFASERTGNVDIWVMNNDGTDLVDLTNNEAKDHSPAWSPDGQWIAFASVRDSLYWELYLMRPDGSDIQRLTWWEDASDLSPSWSPDGTRLAFASKRDGNWEIYTMDRDGSNLIRLTDDPADDTDPSWSPDGGRIAFVSTRDGYAELYVMPVVGGEPVNISNAPFSTELGPTWSPDGGRIAFYSDRDGDWDVYVMASDGSDVIKLTGDSTNDQVPAWRP